MKGDRGLYAIFVVALLLTAVLVLYPVAHAIQLSFQKLDSFVSTPEWVGFANYAKVLALPDFWWALLRGLCFAGLSVGLQVVLGIGFALLLDAAMPERLRPLLRGLLVLPYLLPTVVVALVFKWMLDGSVGILTPVAQAFGYPYVPWGENGLVAMGTVILTSVWIWTPFVTLTCLAALQSIPQELYESARMDGATDWQQFWHVTLPQLSAVLVVVVLLRAVWMFNKFDVIWLMTRGGPMQATEHLPALSFRRAFEAYDVGGGAAVSTISFLILSVAILIYFRYVPIEEKA